MPASSLLQRLKERRFVRWALAYMVFSAGVLGVMDAISEPFSVSVGAQQVIIGFLLFGFLLTLILAWFHGKPGRQGIGKQEALLLSLLTLALVIGMLVVRRAPTDSRAVGTSEEALAKFTEGQFYLNQFTAEGLRRSIILFRQAIDADSTFIEPYVGLGRAYCSRSLAPAGMDPAEAMPLCKETAERILQLDDTFSTAHVLLALYHQNFGWDEEAVARELELASDLGGPSNMVHGLRSWHLAYTGRPEEALTESLRALQTGTNDPISWADAAGIAYLVGDIEEALSRAQHALDLSPQNPFGTWIMGASLAEAGQPDSALVWLSPFREGEYPLFKAFLGYAHALDSNVTEAEAIIRELGGSGINPGLVAVSKGVVLAGLGRHGEAITMFGQATDERSTVVKFVVAGPVGRRLRSQPGYEDLRQILGFSIPDLRP